MQFEMKVFVVSLSNKEANETWLKNKSELRLPLCW